MKFLFSILSCLVVNLPVRIQEWNDTRKLIGETIFIELEKIR